MKATILPSLCALILGFAASAQDKPAASVEKAPASSRLAEQQWEAEAHTTDCSKAPTRTLRSDCAEVHYQVRTIDLLHASSQNDANEILVALRNIADPTTKVLLLTSQNAITIGTYPQDLDRLEAFVRSIDRPHRLYRLSFTLTDSDAGKRLGIQHYSLTMVAGQRTTLKEGSKVPVVTASTGTEASQQQMQYLDIGLSFDATVTQVGSDLQLKTKVEQSSIGEQRPFGDRDPVIRQAVYEGVSIITPGKPMTLGSLDVPNSTRHVDIEVLAEPLP